MERCAPSRPRGSRACTRASRAVPGGRVADLGQRLAVDGDLVAEPVSRPAARDSCLRGPGSGPGSAGSGVAVDGIWAFVAMTVLLSVSPGPDDVLVLRSSLRGGARLGLAAVAGVAAGSLT